MNDFIFEERNNNERSSRGTIMTYRIRGREKPEALGMLETKSTRTFRYIMS